MNRFSMSQELTLQDILEAIHDLSSNNDGRFKSIDRRFEAIEAQMSDHKAEILSHIDWFAAQHNRYDAELLSLRSASLRHEERITKLETSTIK